VKKDRFKYAFCAIAVMYLSVMPAIVQSAGWQHITPERAYNLVKEGSGLWLVDVRSEAEFQQGHLEGAVNIPAETLPLKKFSKQKILVLVDDSLGLR
jgi:predicted sulfurtransferase